MPKQEKMTVGRFFKRNTLYFITAFAFLALIAIVIMGIMLVRGFGTSSQPEQIQQEQKEENVQPPEEVPADPEPLEAEPPKEPGWQANGEFVPPFEGTTTFLVGQKLALTYDPDQLKLTENSGLYTLLPISGGKTPRMDMQQLPTSLDALTDEELDRLAIGILQAYYYVAPKTEDIVLRDTEKTENSYFTVLTAPAYENVPEMNARLRMIQVGSQLWYAVMLLPEDGNTSALEQAFDNLMFR